MTVDSQVCGADLVQTAKVELAAAFRAAALYGFSEGIVNHLSLAVPGTHDRFMLNRYGLDWSEVRASDLVTIDEGGVVVDQDERIELGALNIHLAAHSVRDAAPCVFHTHMPYATALAMTECGLETRANQIAMMFHGAIARLPYSGIAETRQEGERIVQAIGDGVSVVFLDNHGVLVVGKSVPDTWMKLYYLERACQKQVLAQSTGSPLKLVPEEVAVYTAEQFKRVTDAELFFQAVRRQLDRTNPGYEL